MLNYEFPPLGGGAGNANFYLLKEFAKYNNLQIDLITSSVGKHREEQFANNIKIYYLNIEKKKNLHSQSSKDLLKYSWEAYKFSRKLIKEKNYDLIHSFFGIPCGYIAMKLKLPYIVSLRGSDVPFYSKKYFLLDKLIFKKLSKKIWKNSKVVIANSADLKNLALKSMPLQKIEIIYNGVDLKEFSPSYKINKEFTIISTSRLIKRKGIEYLVDGFIQFNREYPNSKLFLAGDGDLKIELEKKTKKSGIKEDAIKFLGRVKHNDLPKIYRKSDVFVLPSLNEGMSNSLLEAMASGLAIIATDTGGSKELIGENNGMIVKKHNSLDIFKALKKIYLNNELLNNMKLSSRKKAEEMNLGKMAKNYFIIYNHNMNNYKEDLNKGKIERGNLCANIDFIKKSGLLDKNKKILEIGCGTGSLTNYFFKKGYNIIGIDINKFLIIKGKELYGNNLPISIGRGENLKYKDNTFDVVLSFDVFEHIFDSDKHLQEVKRIIKNSGYYLLQTPDKLTNIPFEIIKEKSFFKYKKYHCSLHSYWGLKNRFKKHGFEIEFIDISVVNKYFKEKIKRYLGNFGLFLIKIINPDKMPISLKTNFYIITKLKI